MEYEIVPRDLQGLRLRNLFGQGDLVSVEGTPPIMYRAVARVGSNPRYPGKFLMPLKVSVVPAIKPMAEREHANLIRGDKLDFVLTSIATTAPVASSKVRQSDEK
jgi:hypothetical protein